MRIRVVIALPIKKAIRCHAVKTGFKMMGAKINPRPNTDRAPKR
jgi:hypothetical protein